jgi:hypothetical protein
MDKEEQLALAREKAAEVNKGNTYSSKNNRLWADKAASGDVSAIKELGDRIDGKSVATTELTGVDGSNLPISIGINFVKPDDSNISE